MENNELTDALKRLREERNELTKKHEFLFAHKFMKECDFISTKVDVVNKILYELESVNEGRTKGNKASYQLCN